MNRPFTIVLALACLTVGLVQSPALAVEGMWQPHQLKQLRSDLETLGLEIDPDRLTNLLDHPMNAVIGLGFCTASFVSPAGLVITNYHCAYGSIQYNSREGANLEQTGFLAADHASELPARPGTHVYVTVAVDDVSSRIHAASDGLSGGERYAAVEAAQKLLVSECEKDPGHRCNVRAFHGGLQYFRIKQLEVRDVRLVYAPAGSVGQYGGDIDNWMWPRHTGDFAFFRAYVGPDGKTADYSKDNVPYRPVHHLKVSAAGVKEDDFVMVLGYPGRTNRYRTAAEIENAIDWYYPTRRLRYLDWLEIIERETANRPDDSIKYDSRKAGLNNSTKNYQGMLEGFAKSDVVDRKRAQEAELRRWVEADPQRSARYLEALDRLDELIEQDLAARDRDMELGLVRRGSLFSTARRLYRLSREQQKPDADREPGYQERDVRRIRQRMMSLDRTFAADVDRAVWRQFILSYATIPLDQHVAEFDRWFGIEGNQVDGAALDRRLVEMYAKTRLGEQDSRLAWMDADPAAFEASDDPFIQLAVALYPSDRELEQADEELQGQFAEWRSRYMAAVIAYRESRGKPVYPDANNTLRITYGTVQGYSPRDAMVYTPFTRLEGILEKDTGETPFDSPPALLEAARERRHGAYRMEGLDSVPVNFLSDVDTTGGNSGSPSLNGKGELVGLLFDGNYESIIADWDFIPAVTRSIHVDMRYVLWIMTYVDGAGRLLEEMGIPAGQPAAAGAN